MRTFRKIKITLLLSAVCCLAAGFGACKEKSQDPHEYQTIVVERTCTQDGYTLRYCTKGCGTFSMNDVEKALGHTLDETQACTVCLQSMRSTEGLLYAVKEDVLAPENTYAILTGYEGDAAHVTVGYTSDGIPVKEIARDAFQNSSIKSIILCDVVQTVCANAFYRCNDLTGVQLSDGVKDLQDGAFFGCDSLKEIHIPKNVENIGISAFELCESLEKFTVAEENWRFKEIDGNLYLYDGTPYGIKEDYFYLHRYALGKKDKTFAIPEGVTHVAQYAFSDAKTLTKVTIPDTVKEIGSGAFARCDNLSEVTIPDTVTSIGGSAFYRCISLREMEIPASVTEIIGTLFGCCVRLENIRVAADNPAYTAIDGDLYTKDGKTLIEYAIGKPVATFALPNGVTNVHTHAFIYAPYLTEVVLPNGVTELGWDAFYGAQALEKVTVPNTLSKIGVGTFRCPTLKEIVFQGTTAEWAALEKEADWLYFEGEGLKITCEDGWLWETERGLPPYPWEMS